MNLTTSMALLQAPTVTTIPGDGIGLEVMDATLSVLDAAEARLTYNHQLAGQGALERVGSPLPEGTLDPIRSTGLVLKGPLATPSSGGYRSINVTLRQEFDLYANIRPIRTIIPGANIGASAAMFEAVHGTPPDIAGKGVANPTAMLLAACLMLEHVGQGDASSRIRAAVAATLNEDNVRTRDLGGHASTHEYVEAVCARLR